MLIPLLLTLATAPVPSPDGPDQDSAIATAPATSVVLDSAAAPVAPSVGGAGPQSTAPHGLNTDEQIARWLAANASTPTLHDDSPVWRDDRQPHGEVSVGIGTGGYRDYAAAVSLPLGANGRLDISVSQTENGYPYAYGYDPYFHDSGYAFPGRAIPGAALDHERRVARPGGPPWVRPAARPQRPAEE